MLPIGPWTEVSFSVAMVTRPDFALRKMINLTTRWMMPVFSSGKVILLPSNGIGSSKMISYPNFK